jgi:hypothetical protein
MIGEGGAFQVAAIIEGIHVDRFNAVWQGKARQPEAVIEDAVSCPLHTLRVYNMF